MIFAMRAALVRQLPGNASAATGGIMIAGAIAARARWRAAAEPLRGAGNVRGASVREDSN